MVVEENLSKSINNTLEYSPEIPASTTEEIKTFESFEDFSTLPDDFETSENSSEENKSEQSGPLIPDSKMKDDLTKDLLVDETTNVDDESNGSNEKDLSETSDAIIEIVPDTKINQ